MMTPEQLRRIEADPFWQESSHRIDQLLALGRRLTLNRMSVWSTDLVERTEAEIRDAIMIRIQDAFSGLQMLGTMTKLLELDELDTLGTLNTVVLRRFMLNRFTTRELLEFATNLNKEHDDHGNE